VAGKLRAVISRCASRSLARNIKAIMTRAMG
jgi:hypothetical protein